MNQRHQQDPYRGRQGSRSDQEYPRTLQGRGERFGRQFDDDSPRGRDIEDMSDWESGGRGEYYAADDDFGPRQYLGSYPSEQGPRYYDSPRDLPRYPNRGMQGAPNVYYGHRNVPQPGAFGNEDFRQGSGLRNWQARDYGYPQDFVRQGQRRFVGQGSRGASNPDLGYGYGNYRQAPTQGGYGRALGGYARDYDEGDYDQVYGGYSPSQGGYGQSWSGYGTGGYGAGYGQSFGGDEYLGTTESPVQSGAYGQGPGGYGAGFSQGLAGRGGYGLGSGYTRFDEGLRPDYGRSTGRAFESQFGKGPKGYVRSDERLKEDISERLLRDHAIDASDVSIDVRSGSVALTGTVEDRRLKHYVEDLVEACSGVRDIDNRLVVRPRDSRRQAGSGSLGGSTGDGSSSFAGQAAATGTTGSRASTGTPASGTGSSDESNTRSRN